MKDILDEVQGIVNQNQYAPSRPEDVGVTDSEWRSASEETRYLLLRVKDLRKPLGEAYWQAIQHQDWRRAILIHHRMVGAPFLHCISRVLYPEEECVETEVQYIAEAKEWIADARSFLGGEE